MDREVYILLTYTGTLFSKIIKRYIREPYTHVSIAFDKDLNELYSFGRKIPTNPLIAGFVKENINAGVYDIYKDTTYALYSLKITETQYRKLRNLITKFKASQDKSGYNLIGLIGIVCGIPINRENHFFCSQFIAALLKESDVKIFKKEPGLIGPSDFRNSKHLKFIDSGVLKEYNYKAKSVGY